MTSTPTETQPLLKEKPLTFRTKLKAICVGIRARKTLFIYFTLLILFGIANNVAGRWNQLKFGDNYAFFNNQVRGTSVTDSIFLFTNFILCV
jgi:hypothetical protein